MSELYNKYARASLLSVEVSMLLEMATKDESLIRHISHIITEYGEVKQDICSVIGIGFVKDKQKRKQLPRRQYRRRRC